MLAVTGSRILLGIADRCVPGLKIMSVSVVEGREIRSFSNRSVL